MLRIITSHLIESLQLPLSHLVLTNNHRGNSIDNRLHQDIAVELRLFLSYNVHNVSLLHLFHILVRKRVGSVLDLFQRGQFHAPINQHVFEFDAAFDSRMGSLNNILRLLITPPQLRNPIFYQINSRPIFGLQIWRNNCKRWLLFL